MIKAKLLEIDRPTSRGTIYPRAIVEKALADYFKNIGPGKMAIYEKATTEPKMGDIVGIAENFRFEDGYLVADVGFFEQDLHRVARKGEIINIRPNGIGSIDPETNVINEGYRITGLAVVHKPGLQS